MKNFEKLVEDSFNIMNIEISKKDKDSGENIKSTIKDYFEVLIYNIVTVSVVIALSMDTRKITDNITTEVKEYLKVKCSPRKIKGGQVGGTSLPGEYFGYSIDPSRYSVSNGGEESTSTVNFDGGIIRPAISTSTNYNGAIVGGAITHAAELHHFVCTNNSVKTYVREILKQHTMSISKTAFQTILHIIEVHIHCVLKTLKINGPLTLKKVSRVFNSKENRIFR
jgi:phage gpG-like protein